MKYDATRVEFLSGLGLQRKRGCIINYSAYSSLVFLDFEVLILAVTAVPDHQR